MTIEELKRLESEATGGKWDIQLRAPNPQPAEPSYHVSSHACRTFSSYGSVAVITGGTHETSGNDAEFIAALRNAAPALLEAMELVRVVAGECEDPQQYCAHDIYGNAVEEREDCGACYACLARAIVSKLEGI